VGERRQRSRRCGSYTSGPANGDPGGPYTETLTSPYGATKVRFQFESDGAWSDEDGLWDTVGGVNLDDLSTDGGAVEDFEGEVCGAQQSTDGKWWRRSRPHTASMQGSSTIDLRSGGSVLQTKLVSLGILR